jgi:uncharacterized Zn finger protein
MSDYPKVLYKSAQQYDDFQQLGNDIHARKVESVTVRSAAEEDAKVKEGFDHLSKLMGKRPTLSLKKQA